MRKILLLAVLGVVAAFGINSATASAANCNAYNTDAVWTGFLEFTSHLRDCTSVSQVEFKTNPFASSKYDVYAGASTGFGDGTEHDAFGLPGNHPALDAYNLTDSVQNITSSSTNAQVTYRVQAWCNHQAHWIFTQFLYRIKATGGIYGPWHFFRTAGYVILC